ncbi:nitroreductase family protein [Halieaceae bacterium IMCC14734]|uniref:Nitroreductase family protein n=2 Tax=Candidatus Litorirhabdus singularis TaxID=2518993 RepID=A0ABT3TAE6_9GAMM|nr:nitroreductase family protein [Candidatus Litorirhabdus singularis]
MLTRADEFYRLMKTRRSVRGFSSSPIPPQVLESCLMTAGTAPSGANRQPWHFAVVDNPAIKQEIRLGAEAEEREFYQRRAPSEWLDALAPLGTDEHKPFLETAACLIVIFGQKFDVDNRGDKHKNYYVPESVGIATGMLITALHNAGLATLTHTPSPMKFLNNILQRPSTEKPAMILVVGYPEADTEVPDITRKTLDQIASFHNGA